MINALGLALLAVTIFVGPAYADQVQGVVRVSGSAPFKQVVVTKTDQFSGTNLCPGDKAKRLMALETLVVKVWGGEKQQNGSKCFDVGSFKVLKTPAGRDAIVGVLEERQGLLHLLAEDGRNLKLVNVQSDLKALVDKKIIVDLESVSGLKDSGYQTLYYVEFP